VTGSAGRNTDEPDGDEDISAAAETILTVENAGLPLVLLSPDGQVVMANRAMRGLLGYGSDDLVGKSVSDLLAVGEASTESWHELLQTGRGTERLVSFRHRNGSSIATRAAAVVVFNEDGTPRLVITRASAV
jgi:PAS domain S-box-containing protein